MLARARGLAARVHFAGGVADESLPRYYRLADIHLLPSTARAEAFGLVGLEAAASGVPTIASSLPGVRTIVVTTRPGCTCRQETPPGSRPPCACCIRPARAAEAARPGSARAAEARASWAPLIDRLEQTYRTAAAACGRGLN